MNAIDWLIHKVLGFVSSRVERRKRETGGGLQPAEGVVTTRNFDTDYECARQILRYKLNRKFPDNYHARSAGRSDHSYQPGEDRALAVDTMSAAIAASLRNGSSVQQAVAAGAASIGI